MKTTTKSFAVYAATSTEKQEWMAHINKCIEDLLRKSSYSFYSHLLIHSSHTRFECEASVCNEKLFLYLT